MNSEVLPPLGRWFAPLIGRAPRNEACINKSRQETLKAVQILEDHLNTRPFLVEERMTLADLFAVSILGRAFQYVLDKKWRDEHPSIMQWFEIVRSLPNYRAVAGEQIFIQDAL